MVVVSPGVAPSAVDLYCWLFGAGTGAEDPTNQLGLLLMYGVKNGGEDKLKWENPEKKNLKGLR